MIRTLFFISLFQINLAFASSELMTADVSFYSEQVVVQFSADLFFQAKYRPEIVNTRTNKSQLQEFYEQLGRKDYLILMHSLEQFKVQFQLNDWLYYDLMKKSVDVIFRNYDKNHRTIINWFLLCKSGYDARITYQNDQLYLNAYTTDQLFEVPIIQDGNRSLVNLTNLHDKGMALDKLYVARFIPNQKGRALSFDLIPLPKLTPAISSKTLEFESAKNHYEFDIKFDKTLINLMRAYPFIAEHKYLEIPISETLAASLIPIFKEILAGRPWKEKLEILVAFTRTGFAYKTDEEVYGKSKPMITEEIFHYKFSDCEDRSALFYSLVKELLRMPMIILAFPDHITVAVATPEPIGAAYSFDGKKFYVCDPTGPEGSYDIGEVPEGYETQAFEIITKYEGRIPIELERLATKKIFIKFNLKNLPQKP